MKHKLFSRFISVLLAVVVLASLMSMPSLATDDVQEPDQTATSGQTLSEDQTSEDVSDLTEEDSTVEENGTVTDSVTDDNADVTENQTAVTDSAENEEISTDSTEENEDAASEPAESTESTESEESNAESGAATENVEKTSDVQAFYDALMAVQTADEAEALLTSYTTEQLQSLVSSFNEEQLAAVKAHLQDIAAQNAEPIESKVFTDAGPLMPPVDVSSAKMANSMLNSIALYGANDEEPSEDDLVYSKKLEDWNPETGTGKIVIDAYAKGRYTITEETKTVPVDIVLVLDQSGSMADDFDGSVTRQAALKTAVNKFITSVSEKYGETSDHRMAIVEFGSESEVLAQWTEMDTEGAQSLHDTINGLSQWPQGATNIASGMQTAENLLIGNGYNYTGNNKTRHKVVIVFTDGVPTTSSDFSTSVANQALASATSLKEQGVTVYSVGIFQGADPAVLHDQSISGNEGDSWSAQKIFSIFGDVATVDVPAGNRFLNYLSSNFSDANEIGLNRDSINIPFLYEKVTYTISKNFDRKSDQYYLTAKDQESLNQIFETIKDEIGSGSTTVTLDASSVVKDVMTDYFVVDTSDSKSVQAYAVSSTNGVDFDEENKNYSGISAVTSDDHKTVTVTGFDFSEKYVAETGRPQPGSTDDSDNSYHGEMLRIEIPIKVDYTKTLGGNSIPTNETSSGIYVNSNAANPVASFDPCKANVDVNFDFATEDSTVYVCHDANLEEQFSSNATYNDQNVPVDGSTNQFVTITYTVKDGEDVIGTYVIPAGQTQGDWTTGSGTVTNMTECTQYTVTCAVEPSEDPAEGEDGAETYNNAKPAWVHVKQPVIKWQDSTADYKTALTNDFLGTHNVGQVRWEDQVTDHNAPDATTGSFPALTYVYTLNPEATEDQDDTPLLTAETVVSVAVKLSDGKDITEYTTFEWQADEKCPEGETKPTNGQFRIHLGSGDITISKVVEGKIPSSLKNTVFLFQVTGEKGDFNTTVAIKCPSTGNIASITLKNLPADTYTITELPSPGFTLKGENDIQVSVNKNVSFTNTCDGDDWHGDSSSVPNTFTYDATDGWQYVQGDGKK